MSDPTLDALAAGRCPECGYPTSVEYRQNVADPEDCDAEEVCHHCGWSL